MKNLIFFFLLISYAATGQEKETDNKYVLGGSIYFSNFSQVDIEGEIFDPSTRTTILSETTSKTYNVGLRPYWGFQLNRRSLLGLEAQIDFSGSTVRFDGSVDLTTRTRNFTYGAGIFYRFHINPENKLRVFLQPFSKWLIENITISGFNPILTEQRIVEFNTGISLGATYQIAKKWNILVNIGDVRFRYIDFRSGGQTESTIRSFVSTRFSPRNISVGAEYLF